MRHARIISMTIAGGVMLLTAAPSLAAKTTVYGGAVNRGEPIVVTADAKFQKLRTVVIASKLTCLDGSWDRFAQELTTSKAPPGFLSEVGSLKMKKNAKGKFSGSYITGGGSESYLMTIVLGVQGKLSATKASGSFTIVETITDASTMETVTTCQTGTTRFVASRKAGQIFGGTTKQGEPIVIRTDAKHRSMKDFMYSWFAPCDPQGFVHEELTGWRNSSLSKTGAFSISDMYPYQGDNGGKVLYTYNAKGKVGKAAASGTLKASYSEFDAAGTKTTSCDSGALAWKAVTG